MLPIKLLTLLGNSQHSIYLLYRSLYCNIRARVIRANYDYVLQYSRSERVHLIQNPTTYKTQNLEFNALIAHKKLCS